MKLEKVSILSLLVIAISLYGSEQEAILQAPEGYVLIKQDDYLQTLRNTRDRIFQLEREVQTSKKNEEQAIKDILLFQNTTTQLQQNYQKLVQELEEVKVEGFAEMRRQEAELVKKDCDIQRLTLLLVLFQASDEVLMHSVRVRNKPKRPLP